MNIIQVQSGSVKPYRPLRLQSVKYILETNFSALSRRVRLFFSTGCRYITTITQSTPIIVSGYKHFLPPQSCGQGLLQISFVRYSVENILCMDESRLFSSRESYLSCGLFVFRSHLVKPVQQSSNNKPKRKSGAVK